MLGAGPRLLQKLNRIPPGLGVSDEGASFRALHRPAFMPAPAFALRLLLGEMAGAVLLSGQRAIPAKAQQQGYSFRYERLDDALRAIFSGSQASSAR
jgi:hypothetical protein